jgi:predicted 2-oxoglutarate/Fe(II)-dependent dioxygenase YbiX
MPSITHLQAERLVSSAESANAWQPARVVSPDVRDIRGRIDRKDRSASVWAVPENVSAVVPLYRSLEAKLIPLIQKEWNVRVNQHETIQVVRYREGQGYAAHQDVRGPLDGRWFTVLWALNAGYAGGSTMFPRIGASWHGAPGDALVFPSDYLHAAEAVGRGTRYVAVTWIVNPFTISCLLNGRGT